MDHQDMDFLYNDLEIRETETERSLRLQNESLTKQIHELQNRIDILFTSNKRHMLLNETLNRNLSSLIKTARLEINRKNEQIAELKRRLEGGTNVVIHGESFSKLPIPGGIIPYKPRKDEKDGCCEHGCCRNDAISLKTKDGIHVIRCGNSSVTFVHYEDDTNDEGNRRSKPVIYLRLDDGTYVGKRKAFEGMSKSQIMSPERYREWKRKRKRKAEDVEDRFNGDQKKRKVSSTDQERKRKDDVVDVEKRRSKDVGLSDKVKDKTTRVASSIARSSKENRERRGNFSDEKTKKGDENRENSRNRVNDGKTLTFHQKDDETRNNKIEKGKTKKSESILVSKQNFMAEKDKKIGSKNGEKLVKDLDENSKNKEPGEVTDDEETEFMPEYHSPESLLPKISTHPASTPKSNEVDFNSTAGIASILRGGLVTSGYVSPNSGIISTPPSALRNNRVQRNETPVRRSPRKLGHNRRRSPSYGYAPKSVHRRSLVKNEKRVLFDKRDDSANRENRECSNTIDLTAANRKSILGLSANNDDNVVKVIYKGNA